MKNDSTHNRLPVGMALGALLLASSGLAVAEDAEAPKPKWDTTAAAGLTLTEGNSRTLLATLSLDTKKQWEKNEALFGAAGGYGKNRSDVNTEFLQGFGQYNRRFTERFYAGLRLDANYDGIADLDYRLRVTPLAGYYFIKDTNTTLSAEIGPSAVFEKHSGQSEDTYLGLRIGERFEHKLSATTKVWESADYVPQVDKWTEKYVITAEIGIDSSITKSWSLRVVLQDTYDSAPTSGRKNNDIRLIAGTAYKF
jgi:putative salt-induced outer membrane protein YdiY